jgi:membrane protein implicated in regulation of membrane protease activity
LRLPDRLDVGASCRVEYRGTTWTARNVGSAAIESGTEAEICEVAGLTLEVRPANHP